MRKIQIKNIGPLVDTGVIYIKPMMLIIGKQSMGKSTFMKVLCFCEWLEKTIMTEGQEVLNRYTHNGTLVTNLWMPKREVNIRCIDREDFHIITETGGEVGVLSEIFIND